MRVEARLATFSHISQCAQLYTAMFVSSVYVPSLLDYQYWRDGWHETLPREFIYDVIELYRHKKHPVFWQTIREILNIRSVFAGSRASPSALTAFHSVDLYENVLIYLVNFYSKKNGLSFFRYWNNGNTDSNHILCTEHVVASTEE
jgi:hypothetical protein